MTESPTRVLLVEDDEDDFVLTRQWLSEIPGQRFELRWISTYEQGIDALRSQPIDVALVDYRLGGRDGVEFVSEAVGGGCTVPLILLTGQGDRTVDMAAMKAGAADFLHKAQINASLLERSIRYAMQHKRSEEQRIGLLKEQSARAEAEAAIHAKDQFLAMLSHELRTPLSPVLMTVSALSRDESLPERVRDELRMVKQYVELEARLIDDLLDLTRLTRGKLQLHFEVVDLHSVLNDAIRICCDDQALKTDMEIDLKAEAADHHVWADPARLRQVLWNLLKNAAKFSPAGSIIHVSTVNDRPGRIALTVRDKGIGIEPELLPKIFNAFEQGDVRITRAFGGLGLGLTICKALVDQHQGMLSACSDGRGKGSTFTLELATVPSVPATASPANCTHVGSLRILLVEDHEQTLKVMARLLRSCGHSVELARTVADAIKLAAEHRFDALVSDIGLPDGNGADLMRQLRNQYGLRGIALSGFGTEADRQRSIEAGFAEHLTKPVDFMDVQIAIASLMR